MTELKEILELQKNYFKSGKTHNIQFRIKMMNNLLCEIKHRKKDILEALTNDLGKSSLEGFMTEVEMTIRSAGFIISNTPKWTSPKKVKTPILQLGAKSEILQEPFGNTLIISPWNYPFLLSMEPLFGAISAGNTVILKPSEYSAHTTSIISEIISSVLPKEYVYVATGDKNVGEELLNQKFDYIFFTGGSRVGKIVAKKAAENLTPTTLELGGKSPCIVDSTANIKIAARRILFGKLMNCGQTCVAPDYVLADKRIYDKLVATLQNEIILRFGKNPTTRKNYGKIINKPHFLRLSQLINSCDNVIGGERDQNSLKIAPTLVLNPDANSQVMQEEIFGPILPIIPYENDREAITFVSNRAKPLAVYIFSENIKKQKLFAKSLSFGGGCINDTIFHLSTPYLPFGGVGDSGMGAYHGKNSFDTFSHSKGILEKSTAFDAPFRYIIFKERIPNFMKLIYK